MALLGKIIDQTPTISNGVQYTEEDAVGGRLEFADAGFDNSGGQRIAYLDEVIITDLGKQNAILDLFLFDQAFTATADNSALDIADADLPNCLGVVTVSTYYDLNDNSVGVVRGLNMPVMLNGSETLYGQLKTRETPTYTSTSDLTVRIKVLKG